MLNLIKELKHIKELSILHDPVNFDEFTEYPIIVPYPCSISILKERLNNNFYRRLASFRDHFQLILIDARLFNEPESFIIKLADALLNTVDIFLDGKTKLIRMFSHF